jgi:hypothetical protein
VGEQGPTGGSGAAPKIAIIAVIMSLAVLVLGFFGRLKKLFTS